MVTMTTMMKMLKEERLPPVEAMVTDCLCQREGERAARQPQMHVMHSYNLLWNLQVKSMYFDALTRHHSAWLLNISNTGAYSVFQTIILQCAAVKTPTAPLGREPLENGDTQDTSLCLERFHFKC